MKGSVGGSVAHKTFHFKFNHLVSYSRYNRIKIARITLAWHRLKETTQAKAFAGEKYAVYFLGRLSNNSKNFKKRKYPWMKILARAGWIGQERSKRSLRPDCTMRKTNTTASGTIS
jgi:hypothetical protein